MKSIIYIVTILGFLSCKDVENKTHTVTIERADSGRFDIILNTVEKDSIQIIESLLKCRGDSRLFKEKINSEAGWSFLYLGPKDVSIQVKALHLINHYISPELEFYTPFPALYSKKISTLETIKGDIVEETYQYYERWLEKVKDCQCAFETAKRRHGNPLDSTDVNWYVGYPSITKIKNINSSLRDNTGNASN